MGIPVATISIALALAVAAGVRCASELAQRGALSHELRLRRLAGAQLAELFLFVDTKRFLQLNLALLACIPPLVGALSHSVVVGVATFGLLLVAPMLIYRRLRARRVRSLLRQLPDAALAIASALRSGQSLSQALELVPRYQPRPIADEFSLVQRERRLGLALEDSLAQLALRTRLHEFHLLVATLGVARDLGGGLAVALENLAVMVRRRVAMEDRIAALTAQGRLQGLIVGALPLLLILALAVIQPQAVRALLVTPLGWATLTVIVLLELLGGVLIRRIVRIDV